MAVTPGPTSTKACAPASQRAASDGTSSLPTGPAVSTSYVARNGIGIPVNGCRAVAESCRFRQISTLYTSPRPAIGFHVLRSVQTQRLPTVIWSDPGMKASRSVHCALGPATTSCVTPSMFVLAGKVLTMVASQMRTESSRAIRVASRYRTSRSAWSAKSPRKIRWPTSSSVGFSYCQYPISCQPGMFPSHGAAIWFSVA